jgi:hypothetical protein
VRPQPRREEEAAGTTLVMAVPQRKVVSLAHIKAEDKPKPTVRRIAHHGGKVRTTAEFRRVPKPLASPLLTALLRLTYTHTVSWVMVVVSPGHDQQAGSVAAVPGAQEAGGREADARPVSPSPLYTRGRLHPREAVARLPFDTA